MPNTYTQIYIHLVFAVEGRQSLIHADIRGDLYRYITGIVQQRGHKVIAINGMPDHLHLLIGLLPEVALSDLVRDIKAFSSKHINDERWMPGAFRWQRGFGAFSHSRSQLTAVIRYINEQEQHHRTHTFREEYEALLKSFDIDYDPRYVFKSIEDDQ